MDKVILVRTIMAESPKGGNCITYPITRIENENNTNKASKGKERAEEDW